MVQKPAAKRRQAPILRDRGRPDSPGRNAPLPTPQPIRPAEIGPVKVGPGSRVGYVGGRTHASEVASGAHDPRHVASPIVTPATAFGKPVPTGPERSAVCSACSARVSDHAAAGTVGLPRLSPARPARPRDLSVRSWHFRAHGSGRDSGDRTTEAPRHRDITEKSRTLEQARSRNKPSTSSRADERRRPNLSEEGRAGGPRHGLVDRRGRLLVFSLCLGASVVRSSPRVGACDADSPPGRGQP